MNIRQHPPHYHAYMLRLWEERSEDYGQEDKRQGQRILWRFQVEDPHTGRRHGFNDLSGLFVYLQEVLAYDEDAGFGAAKPDSNQED